MTSTGLRAKQGSLGRSLILVINLFPAIHQLEGLWLQGFLWGMTKGKSWLAFFQRVRTLVICWRRRMSGRRVTMPEPRGKKSPPPTMDSRREDLPLDWPPMTTMEGRTDHNAGRAPAAPVPPPKPSTFAAMLCSRLTRAVMYGKDRGDTGTRCHQYRHEPLIHAPGLQAVSMPSSYNIIRPLCPVLVLTCLSRSSQLEGSSLEIAM